MIPFGSIIFGFIFGLIIGSQLKTGNISNTTFKASSYVVIVVVALIIAWQLGEFPYYDFLPFSSGFLSALIGILLSKFIVARSN